VPSSLLLNLETHQSLVLTANDIKDKEEVQGLLFSIAVYLKANPSKVKSLSIDSIAIPISLLNTYSVALQVSMK